MMKSIKKCGNVHSFIIEYILLEHERKFMYKKWNLDEAGLDSFTTLTVFMI